MGPNDPREPDDELAGPDSPGARRAAFGVILGVVAIVVGVLAQLAGYGVVLWLAVAGIVVAGVMIGGGYREWRADAER